MNDENIHIGTLLKQLFYYWKIYTNWNCLPDCGYLFFADYP